MSLLRYTRVYICDIDPPCGDALHTVPQGIMTCIHRYCSSYLDSYLPCNSKAMPESIIAELMTKAAGYAA